MGASHEHTTESRQHPSNGFFLLGIENAIKRDLARPVYRTSALLIAKAFDAIPKGGALVVYEAIIDDARSQNAFGLLMSLNMLIETPGGFDYTGADCCQWMKEAGFSATRGSTRVGPDSMVIGIK